MDRQEVQRAIPPSLRWVPRGGSVPFRYWLERQPVWAVCVRHLKKAKVVCDQSYPKMCVDIYVIKGSSSQTREQRGTLACRGAPAIPDLPLLLSSCPGGAPMGWGAPVTICQWERVPIISQAEGWLPGGQGSVSRGRAFGDFIKLTMACLKETAGMCKIY